MFVLVNPVACGERPSMFLIHSICVALGVRPSIFALYLYVRFHEFGEVDLALLFYSRLPPDAKTVTKCSRGAPVDFGEVHPPPSLLSIPA